MLAFGTEGGVGDCSEALELARAPCGRLSYCEACRCFGLRFGNLYLRLTPVELVRLRFTVTGLACGHAPAMDGFRRFRLSLGSARSAVLVYSDELLELRDLLACGARHLARASPVQVAPRTFTAGGGERM